jgi:L-ascorbate metabolism protein UlaG (beta-lactamase superfamily)
MQKSLLKRIPPEPLFKKQSRVSRNKRKKIEGAYRKTIVSSGTLLYATNMNQATGRNHALRASSLSFLISFRVISLPAINFRMISLPIAIGLMILSTACSSQPLQESENFDGKRFFNPGGPGTKSFSSLLKWRWTANPTPWPEATQENLTFPPPPTQSNLDTNEASFTFINHATVMIQTQNFRVLTDPVFSKRVSPLSWVGPKRYHPPGIEFKDLPKIDMVWISHSHYDHLDLRSLKKIAKRDNALFIVPLKMDRILQNAGIQNIIALDWWEEYLLDENHSAVLTPTQHWSRRGVFDLNKTLWGSFVLKSHDLRIYFAGDTGHGPFFKEIQNRLGPMDVSLLPIGAYEPRWFMKDAHINPEEAVRAHQELGSQMSIGIHFGTFRLTDEGQDQPVTDLLAALKEAQISPNEFKTPRPGETFLFQKESQ